MKAYIVLVWKEKGEEYPELILRKEFLNYVNDIIRDSDICRQIRGLAKEANSIIVNADEDALKKEKNLIFKYRANLDYKEEMKPLEISNEENLYYFIKAYCQKVIVLKVIENDEIRIRCKDKHQILSMMQAIKAAYPDNNEVSTQLCKCLPQTFCIYINKDRNMDNPENPQIICYLSTVEVQKVIQIKNSHKIIWSHLNEWCK